MLNTFEKLSKAILPWVGLIFTVVFGFSEKYNRDAKLELTASNIELAKSKLKVSLIPLLTSSDSDQKAIALMLAKELDEEFATKVGRVLAKIDPDENVRGAARNTLESLTLSSNENISELASQGISQVEIMNELRTKGLLQDLKDAQNFIDGGGPDRYERALDIYQSVIDSLSKDAVDKLNQQLLTRAKENFLRGDKDLAAETYRQLFAEYL